MAWESGAKRWVSYLETLAIGGFYISTKNPAPLESPVKLLMELPVGEVNARGIVRHVNPNKGMGIEIISMNPLDRARLTQMLRPLLPQQ